MPTPNHTPMRFFRPESRVDGELELVPPAARWVDDFLLTCAHPLSWSDTATHWTREQLLAFVQNHPGGLDPGDRHVERWPAYYFWLRLRPARVGTAGPGPDVPIAGTLSFRVGDDDDLLKYWGHIGYGVFPPARGHRYAERACRLIFPLARRHGMRTVWITCNPDNAGSRRTCERLGAVLVETVTIPPTHRLQEKGETHKCRYRFDL